jgi:hypothetical protein
MFDDLMVNEFLGESCEFIQRNHLRIDPIDPRGRENKNRIRKILIQNVSFCSSFSSK